MYKEILLAVDLQHDSSWTRALPVAVDLCRSGGARLHVMTVVPDFGMSIVGQFFPKGYEEELSRRAMAELHEFVKNHVPDDVKVQHVVSDGTVYEAILNIARKVGADLIVVAAHRPELKDYLLGPNAARVVRHADCSVLVVRE
ncbi:MAG: universal stress protein [Hyphomicrobiales bacterium]|nr:universal stress protein [Hyphomicrobiales bacterium]MCP5372589.1 universal stress protein [Hyphomicrobiales bacterium]